MGKTELRLRFTYHPPKDGQPAKYTALRDAAMAFAGLISDLVPENREQALAITAVEEAVMWANAGIARGAREKENNGLWQEAAKNILSDKFKPIFSNEQSKD